MAQKFIIDEKSFRLGHVDMHYELAPDDSKVKGGGYWFLDSKNNKLFLYGKSIDFGRVSIEQLTHAKNNLMISERIRNLDWIFSESDDIREAMKSEIKI